MNWKVFVETNIYNLSCLLRDGIIKTRKIFFIWMLIASVSLTNFCWLVFLGFYKTTHDIYEPIITRMLIAYWHLQNRDISLFLNIDCLFLFHKLLLKWTSKFLWKQPYMSLQLGWCLLRNDVIKVGKFLFVWTLLIVST